MLTTDVPLNSAAWMIGSLTVFVLCMRLWTNYKNTNNYLSFILFWVFLDLGVGFFALSFPLFFTTDPTVVRYAYLTGDLFRLLSTVLLAWTFWFIGLKKRVSLRWLVIPALIMALVGWVDEIYNFYPFVSGRLVVLDYPFLSTLAQVVLLSLFGVGTGLIFIGQGLAELRKYKKLNAAIKSITLGIGFVLVPGSVVLNNFINRGGENITTSIAIIAGFVVALVGLEIPHIKRALGVKAAQGSA